MMIVERIKHSGAITISDFTKAGDYLLTRTYYGYTLKEAKAQFKIALEGEGK
jgi:hypothetical protein